MWNEGKLKLKNMEKLRRLWIDQIFFDIEYLDETIASGMIHLLSASAIIEVRYETGLVDVISYPKSPAGVQIGGIE